MRKLIYCSAASALALAACVDATVIGGDQFATGSLPVAFTDTVPFTLATERAAAASLATELRTSGVSVAYVGCFESGLTGRTSATLGLELVEATTPRLDPSAVTIDSAVLVLPLAPTLALGDSTAAIALRVEAAAVGTIGLEEATFADALTSTDEVYGRYAGTPPRTESLVNTFLSDGTTRVDTVAPQIRIPLDDNFVAAVSAALRRDTPADTLRDDEGFIADFPGILLRGDGCATQLPALSLAPTDAGQFGVTIYYSQDTTRRQFRLVNRRLNTQGSGLVTDVAEARVAYAHDYAGSTADTLLDGRAPSVAGAAVQGLQGLNVAVEFSDISSFGRGRGVTFAELLLPVDPDAETSAEPIERLVLRVRNSSGDLVDYSAVPSAQNPSGVYSPLEGGVLERIADPRGGTDSIPAYRFNITSLFQEFVSGARDPAVFLSPTSVDLLAGESALVGPGTTPLRARLRVASAELP